MFKEFDTDEEAYSKIFENLLHCSDEIDHQESKTSIYLGLEPEPLGLFETTPETVSFFEKLKSKRAGIRYYNAGINYDCCHLAVEFEEAQEGLNLWTKRVFA